MDNGYLLTKIDNSCMIYYTKLKKIELTVVKYVNLFKKYDSNNYNINFLNLKAALNNKKNNKVFSELKNTSNVNKTYVSIEDKEKENDLIYLQLSNLHKTLSKYIKLFEDCDHDDYEKNLSLFTAALNNEKIYSVLYGLKDQSNNPSVGGNLKSNVKYISTKTKTDVKMKSGSFVSRIIYHKKGDKKETKYVKINSEYVKYCLI